jgi:hypothetical protein
VSRFVPESLTEALLRPVAMASPTGGVYVEFISPDFRFLFLLVLVLAVVAWSMARRDRLAGKPALVLATFVAVAFAPWLATSGNGRYFTPVLLLAGPACIGLLHLLPATRGFKLAAGTGMLVWQALLLHDVGTSGAWTFVHWRNPPAFAIDVPADLAASPATYVTLSDQSYSLIAPRFHDASRWINISGINGWAQRSIAGRRAREFLSTGDPLRVVFPAPNARLASAPLQDDLRAAIDALLARQNLSIADPAGCRRLVSAGLGLASTGGAGTASEPGTPLAFWVCPLARNARQGGGEPLAAPSQADAVFDALENACPALFRRGEAVTLPIPSGALRAYTAADTKVYVLEDGTVMYKYARSLNAEVVGTVQEVLGGGFRMDCAKVRRRSALPWQRAL